MYPTAPTHARSVTVEVTPKGIKLLVPKAKPKAQVISSSHITVALYSLSATTHSSEVQS